MNDYGPYGDTAPRSTGSGSSLDSWTDRIGKLGGTASGILSALNRPKTTAAAAPAAAPAPANWGMIAAIGGAVLLFVVLLVAFAGGSHK